MSQKQPLVVRKMLVRFTIGLFVIAAAFAGFTVIRNLLSDPDFGTAETKDWIAAVKDTPDGSQLVAILPDGSVKTAPDYESGKTDQSPTWTPDGQRILFSSDRGAAGSTFHIWRWNPAANTVRVRTLGSRSQNTIVFPAGDTGLPTIDPLIVSSGMAVQLELKSGHTTQLIPAVGKDPTAASSDDASGFGSQFGPEFEQIGTSIRKAQVVMGGKYIVAIANRDDGQTLMIQQTNPTTPEEAAPHAILAGQHIDFDTSADGTKLVYSIQKFHLVDRDHPPKEFVKNGRLVLPYQHVIGVLDLTDLQDPAKSGPIAISDGDNASFGKVAISPDGSRIVFESGRYSDGVQSMGLFICPMSIGGSKTTTPIVQGKAYSPSWSPDGSKICFIESSASGSNDVWVVGSDGSNPKNLTNGSGNFSDPEYSPAKS